jgi:hypothetical protein
LIVFQQCPLSRGHDTVTGYFCWFIFKGSYSGEFPGFTVCAIDPQSKDKTAIPGIMSSLHRQKKQFENLSGSRESLFRGCLQPPPVPGRGHLFEVTNRTWCVEVSKRLKRRLFGFSSGKNLRPGGSNQSGYLQSNT